MLIISVLISIIVIVYIARDAQNYDKNPWGWGVFAFFFGFLALGIFLCITDRPRWGSVWILVWVAFEVSNLLHGRLVL